jgi:hypothetical protein
VNLEGLLEGIRDALLPTGTFVTCDTIGRNGHMRWPEALEIVNEYWRELPRRYRHNCLLDRHEEAFENWDCSSEGFEGIRAQDILPLLIGHFDFDLFVPFANVIDPFIDRCFGPNFDPADPWDRSFIDRVHARDRDEILRGAVKPTHVVAAMCSGRPGRNEVAEGLSPRFCVRSPLVRPRAYRPRRTQQRTEIEDAPEHVAGGRFSARNGIGALTVIPAAPQAFDLLVAKIAVPSGRAFVTNRVVLSGAVVRAEARSVATEPDRDCCYVQLGRFPAGVIGIVVSIDGIDALECTVSVRERMTEQGAPCVDYTDLWWNPDELGWGLSIHQHPSHRLMANWQTYAADGASKWYSLQPGRWLDEVTYQAVVIETRENPAAVTGVANVDCREVGEATLRFDDPDHASFSYVVDGRAGSSPITRMRY